MNLLVIGATGFIGRHVHARATAAGAQVVTVSRSPGQGDVCLDLATSGPTALARVIRAATPDAIINCAGVTRGDAADMVAGNVVAVANLVMALTTARAAPRTRLIHLGSAAEYGDVPQGTPVAESCPARPLAAYGFTKLAGTELVRSAAATGLDAVVLRVFNPVGPGSPESNLAGRLVAELRRTQETGEDVHVGPLGAYRDFIDVRDVADAALAVARAPGRLPALLNVGSGRATRLRELARLLTRFAASGPRILEDAPVPDRSSGVAWQQADIRAIGEALGWAPTTDLTTSMRDLWEEVGCLT